MSKKTWAILFAFGKLGVLRQAIKFWTNPVYDVIGDRMILAVILSIVALVLLFLTIRFWNSRKKRINYFNLFVPVFVRDDYKIVVADFATWDVIA